MTPVAGDSAQGDGGQRVLDAVLIAAPDAIGEWMRHEALFIDVREPREWNLFRIPGAVHVPLGTVGDRMRDGETIAAHDRRIVVYCGRGNRSRRAAAWLAAWGYSAVRSLDGGVMEWIFCNGTVEE